MKQQLSLMICAFACIFFMSSCQKETSSLSLENEASFSMSQADVMRPFKGDYVTVAQFPNGTPTVQIITGTGEATHMGQGQFVANATVNFSTPPPFAVAGTAVFTAANGDQFFTQFTGQSIPTGNGNARGIINHVITGGNGRFANATGTLTGNATVTAGAPTNTVSYEGSISY